ncbi:MAG: beta-galactosidase, partial [Pseudomonadota bacterium]
QTYRHFDEIDLPMQTVTEANPAHRLDFYRFSSDQVVAYNRLQTDILKKQTPYADVYHNFMGHFLDFDHFDLGKDIDVAVWDSYPSVFLIRRHMTPKPSAFLCDRGTPILPACTMIFIAPVPMGGGG